MCRDKPHYYKINKINVDHFWKKKFLYKELMIKNVPLYSNYTYANSKFSMLTLNRILKIDTDPSDQERTLGS